MSSDNGGNLIRLGGLWKKTGRNGTTFLSGTFGQAGLLVFRNTRKERDSDPDYVAFVAPGRERQRQAQPSSSRPSPAAQFEEPPALTDEDIPF